ncbi:hypothetical protein GCM10011488_16630 [Steroidobacter agaridevorans]|nr:hypothetical protein GCM10011488_16630 [Steroidobacter agaridevorans]
MVGSKHLILALIGCLLGSQALAHGVAPEDQALLRNASGPQLLTFMYLGAKHMVTGYDHLLFLFGVIFFLYRLKEVVAYVTLFAIGHSVTLLFGVLSGLKVDPYLIDAIIGFSVVYKALDNLGAFQRWFGIQPNNKAAVLVFGFFHGFGLATKLQDLSLSADGLVPNMLAFNVGVEIGQVLALSAILIVMTCWRRVPSFTRHATAANVLLMAAGFGLVAFQLNGYFVNDAQASTEARVMHAHPRKPRTVRIEINVQPREELEYKAELAAGEPLLYSWTTQGAGPVYYEFHGEPTEGEWPKDYYRSYETVESSQTAHGSFVAPFTGRHGWYWRNLSDAPLTIVLEVNGYFTKLGRIEAPATL